MRESLMVISRITIINSHYLFSALASHSSFIGITYGEPLVCRDKVEEPYSYFLDFLLLLEEILELVLLPVGVRELIFLITLVRVKALDFLTGYIGPPYLLLTHLNPMILIGAL